MSSNETSHNDNTTSSEVPPVEEIEGSWWLTGISIVGTTIIFVVTVIFSYRRSNRLKPNNNFFALQPRNSSIDFDPILHRGLLDEEESTALVGNSDSNLPRYKDDDEEVGKIDDHTIERYEDDVEEEAEPSENQVLEEQRQNLFSIADEEEDDEN
ncbi:3562_t:CDS:2 [Acaulospora morrowiae]|uniref:3562_t:CDS:1 n=1 Tax=Acaulospora morrowiae TaxID=94023 RepID=A0A9N8ZT68_9GLOM|nr:3562_t:CDS:2 [Acaulospora morrowiae]